MKSEIRVEVPADCRLVGVRTDGDVVVIIYEPIQNVRQIDLSITRNPTTKPRNPKIKSKYAVQQ